MDHLHNTDSNSHHGIDIDTDSPSTSMHPHRHHHNPHHQHHPQASPAHETHIAGGNTGWLSSQTTDSMISHNHVDHHNHQNVHDYDPGLEDTMTHLDHEHHQHPDSHLHPSAGHGHGHGVHHDVGHMKPVFTWVTDVPVLFEGWTTSTALELALAMLAAAFLAALYELLRNWLSTWDNNKMSLSAMPWWKRMCVRSFRALMHALNAAVGYVQMLFAMTFDLRVFVAIILGSGLGFFVLGPYFRRINLQQRLKRSGSQRGQGHRSPRRTAEDEPFTQESRSATQCHVEAKATEVPEETGLLHQCSVDRETVL